MVEVRERDIVTERSTQRLTRGTDSKSGPVVGVEEGSGVGGLKCGS